MRYALTLTLAALSLFAASGARGGYSFAPPADTRPVWSPDDTAIVYYRWSEGLHVVSPDGSGNRLLTGLPNSPYFAFSRDWHWLAFTVFQGTPNAARIEVMRPDGSNRRIVAPSALATIAPAFSPDDRRVAYARSNSVWIATVDGSAPPLRIGPSAGRNLTWSPDGTRVAFDVIGGTPQVEIAVVDGSGVVRVQASSSTGPSWSPDGRTIAYFTTAGGKPRIAFDNGDAHVEYPIRSWANTRPLWSPDGATVYYVDRGELFGLDVATGVWDAHGIAGPDVALSSSGGRIVYGAGGECANRVGIYIRSPADPPRSALRLTSSCIVLGTDGDDVIYSSATLFQIVQGGYGNDTLIARGAPVVGDSLGGGPGDDVLRGSVWPDKLTGGDGGDVIYGGPNQDVIYGGGGRDKLYGDGGRDTIWANDGDEPDFVDCGTNTGKTNKAKEADVAYVDRFDVVMHCEHVFRSR